MKRRIKAKDVRIDEHVGMFVCVDKLVQADLIEITESQWEQLKFLAGQFLMGENVTMRMLMLLLNIRENKENQWLFGWLAGLSQKDAKTIEIEGCSVPLIEVWLSANAINNIKFNILKIGKK